MRSFNNDVEISRNEPFSIDRIIKFTDGSPYIVSSELRNPYFLVSVSTTQYEQANRKVYNKWLDLKDFPRFTNTVPVDLKSLLSEPNGLPQYNSFDDITSPIEVDGVPNVLAHGYVDNNHIYYEPQDAVFYIENENEEKIYKYWSVDGWKEYTCRIVTVYDTEITSQWVGQNYLYSIDLVSGQAMREYLEYLADENNVMFDEFTSNEEIYDILNNKGVVLIEKNKLDRKLVKIDMFKPILKPKKLIVSTNLLGGL